jgi:hypothetical protein
MLDVSEGAGWHGTVDTFLASSTSGIRDGLRQFVSALVLPVSDPQLVAWTDSIRMLKSECQELVRHHPETAHWGLILEYELLREGGRRPDLVILTGCSLNVIEFKGRSIAEQADVDQVIAYGRDLAEYHGGSRDLSVNRILALDATSTTPQLVDDVWIVGGRRLGKCLGMLAEDPPCKAPDVRSWIRSDYSPLPSLVKAARRIFEHEPLPQIRRASSAGIPEALHSLQVTAGSAQKRSERHIALITGVPGAGKTLVGLQLVYNTRFTDEEGERAAVFLSGNGPLIDVLQHALKSRIFVQDVHRFLLTYGGKAARLPDEHIWVYDEAQRAWDADRVRGKRGHDLSEHEDFLRLGLRMPGWSMLVGLIGEGQEIHLGEEGGLELWNEAVKKSGGEWIVHCPSHVAPYFHGRQVVIDETLNLSVTLRSHLASDLHAWVAALLEGRLADARRLCGSLRAAGFSVYVTRNLEDAKSYVRERYADRMDTRYGMLASSKAKTLAAFGMDSSFQATRRFRPGPWYNDPPSSLSSCCQLLSVATEFQCQGLELDFPIVGWDLDLLWNGSAWASKGGRSSAKDPHRLRLNSYRVLLTRGRDGMMIFVPPLESSTPTYRALCDAGCEAFERVVRGVDYR